MKVKLVIRATVDIDYLNYFKDESETERCENYLELAQVWNKNPEEGLFQITDSNMLDEADDLTFELDIRTDEEIKELQEAIKKSKEGE